MRISVRAITKRCAMTSVLNELAQAARERVAVQQEALPIGELRSRARSLACADGFPFERALSGPGMSFICECKKASPSKGLISESFPYLRIAREYEQAGASALSVLTEPTRFLGSDAYLSEIAATVAVPCLRKDFTVDAYMVYQAKLLGAQAILLICSILDDGQLKEFIALADELGMSALVEAHDEREVNRALRAGARIVGVNNRNLVDFSVDFRNCLRLRDMVPPEVLFVAESGVSEPSQVRELEGHGVNAVLVGEALMRAADKRAALSALRGEPL